MLVSHTMRVAAIDGFRLWTNDSYRIQLELAGNGWHVVQSKAVVEGRGINSENQA